MFIIGAKGSDYVKYHEQMIDKDIRTNNEFYVCNLLQQAIVDDKKVKDISIPKDVGFGTQKI